MNFRRFSRRFWRGYAIVCFSALAVVMSDAAIVAQTAGSDSFDIPAINLALDPETDSAGAVPEGLNVSLDPVADGERGIIGWDNRTLM